MLTKASLLTLSMICRQLLHSGIHVKTDFLHSFGAVLIYAHTSTNNDIIGVHEGRLLSLDWDLD